MRFYFTADKILLSQLYSLQCAQQEDDVKKSEIVVEAVQMLYQINLLLESGYKLALIDPKGKKTYIKKNKFRNDNDEK